jgi:hypothetical protein
MYIRRIEKRKGREGEKERKTERGETRIRSGGGAEDEGVEWCQHCVCTLYWHFT